MAIARVQSISATTAASTSATSLVLTLASPTTTGNFVVVAVASGTIVDMKVSSAHGIFQSYSPGAFDIVTANESVRIFWAIMTGADTAFTIVNVQGAAIQATAAVAVEYSGAGVQPDNIPAPIGASGINAANTGNVGNTNANALFVGVIGIKTQSSTQNTSWATNNIAPFSIVAQNCTNNGTTNVIDRAIVYLDAIVSTTSIRGANVNHGFGTNRYAGFLATFNQVATGGGGLRAAGHGGLAA